MKKQLNEAAITNELRGGSVFFRPPGSPVAQGGPTNLPSHQPSAPPVEGPKLTIGRAEESPGRPIAPTPVRRIINRHAFELYQDQVDTLRRMALEGQLAGEKISMSEMVREALDNYISEQRGQR